MLVTDKDDPQLKAGQQNSEGQHSVYLVLSKEERAKGFVRPVRRTYVHTGKKIERHPDGRLYGRLVLDYEETDFYNRVNGYGGYIEYPANHKNSVVGRYLTEEEADAIVARKAYFGGCGVATKMGTQLSETYARDPEFYGATFCYVCNKHLPVDQFEWEDGETVGS